MRDTIFSHGWYQLAPFSYDESKNRLTFVSSVFGQPKSISVRETEKSIAIESDYPGAEMEIKHAVRHILRLNEPFAEFYEQIAGSGYEWIAKERLGPLLRSPTVFEDLVKTICTTNCTWSLTKMMTTNLVEKLGGKSDKRTRSFPTAHQMASKSGSFFEKEIRSGYRGPYLLELAESVASGKFDPESWLESELTTDELRKEMKKIKGVGNYAAENLLKLIGRYDGLALDSFLRSGFYTHHNRGKRCSDKKIERFYSDFGKWKGLVIWFDIVRLESKD